MVAKEKGEGEREGEKEELIVKECRISKEPVSVCESHGESGCPTTSPLGILLESLVSLGKIFICIQGTM